MCVCVCVCVCVRVCVCVCVHGAHVWVSLSLSVCSLSCNPTKCMTRWPKDGHEKSQRSFYNKRLWTADAYKAQPQDTLAPQKNSRHTSLSIQLSYTPVPMIIFFSPSPCVRTPPSTSALRLNKMREREREGPCRQVAPPLQRTMTHRQCNQLCGKEEVLHTAAWRYAWSMRRDHIASVSCGVHCVSRPRSTVWCGAGAAGLYLGWEGKEGRGEGDQRMLHFQKDFFDPPLSFFVSW